MYSSRKIYLKDLILKNENHNFNQNTSPRFENLTKFNRYNPLIQKLIYKSNDKNQLLVNQIMFHKFRKNSEKIKQQNTEEKKYKKYNRELPLVNKNIKKVNKNYKLNIRNNSESLNKKMNTISTNFINSYSRFRKKNKPKINIKLLKTNNNLNFDNKKNLKESFNKNSKSNLLSTNRINLTER